MSLRDSEKGDRLIDGQDSESKDEQESESKNEQCNRKEVGPCIHVRDVMETCGVTKQLIEKEVIPRV